MDAFPLSCRQTTVLGIVNRIFLGFTLLRLSCEPAP